MCSLKKGGLTKEIMNKYGHFSKDKLEFIVTEPDTPRPWINYLTNEDYCAIISQCAGGYSFYKDCRTDRILRWSPENLHFDRPGRYIYVKSIVKRPTIVGAPKSKVWSATYQPLRVKPAFYECRHGLGYTVITTEYDGVRFETTYFVPENEPCEVWLCKVTNKTKRAKELELYPYVEFLLGDYHLELRYRNIMELYNRIWLDQHHQALFAKKTAAWGDLNIKPFEYTIFFATSLPLKGYCTRKEEFLGRYNNEERPQMLFNKFKTVKFCSGEDGIGVLRNTLKLAPGKQETFSVLLGQTESIPNITHILSKFRNIENCRKEFENVKNLWHKRIVDNIWVETPDKDFDTIMNVWVKYQMYICNFWSRSPSYFHEGSGGRGFRDSCQDADGIMSINTEHALNKIRSIVKLIRQDGTCAPGWSDTSGPAGHRPNKDHPLWLTYTVASYIKETGNKDFLLEYAPYIKDRWIQGWDTDPHWQAGAVTDGEGTIFEHLEKNLEFTFNDVGPHGLPRVGHADWNDALDAVGIKGKGESVWIAIGLVRSLKILSELAQLIGLKEKSQELLRKAGTMTKRINDVAWDGHWYLAGFTDDGTAFGSSKEKEGRIYLNSQSWAILAGVCDEGKKELLLKSVDKYLDREHGYELFYPAYTHFNPKLGRISMFSEGTKENAAIFCHAATFMIVADCQAGRGTEAYKAIKKVMPNAQKDYDLYKTEPYTYAEYLIGPEHPYLYGEGAFTWITGTAGWTFMAGIEWFLGVRHDYEGLRIDPCIPSTWKGFKVRRPFRGAIYDISVNNPDGVEQGVKELIVDGESIEGNLVRPHSDGKIHRVNVVMG